MKRTGRDKQKTGHRGGESSGGHGTGGRNDEQWDPDEQDPHRYPHDDEDDPSCMGNDEYIWPEIEDDPDD
jgi:hypothetical protein